MKKVGTCKKLLGFIRDSHVRDSHLGTNLINFGVLIYCMQQCFLVNYERGILETKLGLKCVVFLQPFPPQKWYSIISGHSIDHKKMCHYHNGFYGYNWLHFRFCFTCFVQPLHEMSKCDLYIAWNFDVMLICLTACWGHIY